MKNLHKTTLKEKEEVGRKSRRKMGWGGVGGGRREGGIERECRMRHGDLLFGG